MTALKRLVGDIGGTNARFALLDASGRPEDPETLRTDDFPGLVSAVQAFLHERGIERLDAAAIAVANPVVGDLARLTNNHWSFSISETREQLGLSELHVVNDFTALALSLPYLTASERVQIGGGEALDAHTRAVIGAGTGLGVSGLIYGNGRWYPLQGEGGHVTVGVRSAREFAVQERLARRFRHVSAERFLSGPGLQNIHDALREIDGDSVIERTPAMISEMGLAGEDAHCVETLDMFCAMLGSCAGNLALTLGAEGGVFIGGGVVPRLGDYFYRSRFREEFEAKGRMSDYLKGIATFVITADYPALTGVSRLLCAEQAT